MHTNEELKAVLAKYWGYEGYLPNQERAMECALRGRDSIVVLPTGGGKSLCFQAPAVAMPGLAVVVSPLLSLMKDQVDALAECGISAGRIDSMQTPDERQEVFARIHDRSLKVLYLSPERLLSEGLLPFLQSLDLSLIAIDEAHCVSMWGHDFRPEYRQLGRLKEVFPNVARHAYTATATEQVRRDIAVQLKLDSPEVIVGSFDRPNLIYKVERRADKLAQICQVLDRHKGESGIVYCLRRKDVDRMCDCLRTLGHNAAPYHAGMEDIDRKKNQDGFIKEKIDIIVATVAFGMGIDKSNVRYVIHSGMPKSLEHYQQESGRAGRDGLDAECVLFYGADDFMFWKRVLQDLEGEPGRIAFRKLRDMQDYADGITCRHRALVGYFGQKYEKDNCGACDVCLGNMDVLEDPLVTAQKILSCIVRLKQAFGAGYTAMVLTGSHEQRILQNHHHNLSTYGLMSDHTQKMVLDWIEQLVSQGYIWRTQEEYSVLNITEKGWQVLKGQETPRLLKPAAKPAKTAKVAEDSWEGVDRDLFEDLRQLRREIADSKGVPAFLVFGDASLRDMARKRPSSEEGFSECSRCRRQEGPGIWQGLCESNRHLLPRKFRRCGYRNQVLSLSSRNRDPHGNQRDQRQVF